jgi:Inactive DUF488-N3 subclade
LGDETERWLAFRRRYEAKPAEKGAALQQMARLAREDDVTIVYAARDERYNRALVTRDRLNELSWTLAAPRNDSVGVASRMDDLAIAERRSPILHRCAASTETIEKFDQQRPQPPDFFAMDCR